MQKRILSPYQARDLVKAMVIMKRPVMLHGSPGIGKSDIIRGIGKELGREVIDARLVQMSEIDLRGMPVINRDDNTMVWAPASFLPKDPRSTAILFLDEISQAAPAVQAAALQLCLDRRLGDYVLPEGVSIVAAGNRVSDKTGAKKLISALANRFMHIEIEANFKDWQNYAINAGVHPDIIGFLSHKPQYLNQDPIDGVNTFATPRMWQQFVDPILKSKDIPADMLVSAISGCVGEAIALEFASIRKIMSDLPVPDDVISGKATTLRNKEIAAQFSLVTSCLYRLRELNEDVANNRNDMDAEKWWKGSDTFMGYALDNLEPEIIVMALTIAISQMKLPFNHQKMPKYKEFFTKYNKLMKSVYPS